MAILRNLHRYKKATAKLFGSDSVEFDRQSRDIIQRLSFIMNRIYLSNTDSLDLGSRSCSSVRGLAWVDAESPCRLTVVIYSKPRLPQKRRRLIFYRLDFSSGMSSARIYRSEIEVNSSVKVDEYHLLTPDKMKQMKTSESYDLHFLDAILPK